MQPRDDPIQVIHVDDEPDFANMVATFIEREDDQIQVDTATSASECLDQLESGEIDCIISDYDMPGRNGIEFLQVVRERGVELPFILFTGKGSEEVAGEAIRNGATDYLQKGSGTSQYTVLVNRIRNSVAQYRSRQLAADLDRVRTLISDINQALVRARTQDDLEREVCEILSEAEPYRFAWIGSVDSQSDHVEPRTWAGVESGYLDQITITTDERETGQGPTGTAVREQRVAVVQDIQEDPVFDPWRAEAKERGYRASAAIPLEYEGTFYGVLSVYADRSHAFDEQERELLAELGDDIAHASYRADMRTRQERYRRIVENLPVGVYRVTPGPDGKIADANPALADIFGAGSAEEMIGIEPSTFYVDPEERLELSRAVEREGMVENEVLRQRTLDGDLIWISVTAIRVEEDGDLYFDGVIQDITERREQERRREQIIERVTDAIVEVDANWQFTLVNEQAEEFYDMCEDDLLGRSFWDVFTEALGTRFEDEYRAVMQTREPTSFMEYYEGLDGWFDIEAYPNNDGGVAFYFRDVTGRFERQGELEQQAERLQYLEDVSDIGYWEIDTSSPPPYDVTLSDGVYQIHDLSPGEPFDVEKGIQFYHPEDRETVRTDVERAISDAAPYDHEVRLITATGQERWVHSVGEPIEREGEVVRVRGVFQDITERKSHEKAIEQLHSTTRDLLAAQSPDEIASITCDAATGILDLPLIGVHLYDANKDVLAPVAWSDALASVLEGEPPSIPADEGLAWEAFEDSETQLYADVLERSDRLNTDTSFRSELHLPLGEHGIIIVGSTTTDDIDGTDATLARLLAANVEAALDRVEREQERAEEHEKYEIVVERSHDGITIIQHGEFVFVNPRTLDILGYEESKLIDKPFVEVVHPDDREWVHDRYEQRIDPNAESPPPQYETRIQTDDGATRFVQVSAAPIQYEGEPADLVIVRDVTERKHYEEQLEETTEELEVLNRVVRHDIRNDMAIILGWAELLEDHLDEDGQEYLQKILASGEHVVELTEIARDYIETLTSGDDLTVTPTPLRSVLETELDLRRESFPDADFVVSSDIPDVAVTANEMLGSVFRNLLNNAVQHNDKDNPTVTISCERDDEDVIVEIADNGPGLPDDQKDSIFSKGDKGIESSGSGIGLYLVRTLVNQYKGTVTVDDNEPEGVVFTVRLPQAE